MTRSLSGALLLLLAGVLPASAGAQITTGLTPPAPRPTAAQRAAAESTIVAVRDSIAEAERLDMRAWVDSAARALERGGLPVTEMPGVPGDSLVPDPTPGAPPPRGAQPGRSPAPADSARPGARADSTGRSAPPADSTRRAAPADSARGAGGAAAPASRPPAADDGALEAAGVPAPDTASPLPLLAAVGLGTAGAGVRLLRGR